MACSSAKCEEYLAIDLAHLRRQGILRSGLPALLSWSRGNEPAGYIIVLPLRDGLRLIYWPHRGNEDESEIETGAVRLDGRKTCPGAARSGPGRPQRR
jgi:hypothetical protein